MPQELDIAVIGGGFAGLGASLQYACETGNRRIAIFDHPLAESKGALGGFAKFSGAKLSLPPAGMGLLALVQNDYPTLIAAYRSTLELLGIAGFRAISKQIDSPLVNTALTFREYSSIMLGRPDLEKLIARAAATIARSGIRLITARVIDIEAHTTGSLLRVSAGDAIDEYLASKVIFAAGRKGSHLLTKAGAQSQKGKGIDIGFRIEFGDQNAIAGLRSLGLDAKVIFRKERTFCLNSPGSIFYYDLDGIRSAGGIIADQEKGAANFGILSRVGDKASVLARLRSSTPGKSLRYLVSDGTVVGRAQSALEATCGARTAASLVNFAEMLGDSKLVAWRSPHVVHIPLADWHWNVFALPSTFETTLPGVYAIGDCSGHARGLLQAAVSGFLVAQTV